MIKKNLIMNPWLALQIEAQGKEVKRITNNSKLLGIMIINPIERLHKKGVLTRQEYHAGVRYSNDYELANLSHHSRPMYDGSAPAKGGKPIQRELPQGQLNASKRYESSKRAVDIAELTEKKKLPQILRLVFEQQKSFHNVEITTKTNHKLLEERVKLICRILLKI